MEPTIHYISQKVRLFWQCEDVKSFQKCRDARWSSFKKDIQGLTEFLTLISALLYENVFFLCGF